MSDGAKIPKRKRKFTCAFCGREFWSGASRPKFCSRACLDKERYWRCRAPARKPEPERRPEPLIGDYGVTKRQYNQIVYDQHLPPHKLAEAAKLWTDPMRRAARRIYNETHGLFKVFNYEGVR